MNVFSPLAEMHMGEHAIDIMTTQGRLSFFTIACEIVDLPDPELPATAMMLTSAHGGE